MAYFRERVMLLMDVGSSVRSILIVVVHIYGVLMSHFIDKKVTGSIFLD